MKQIIYELKSQPVVSGVSIIGTALAIFLIMVVVMLQQVKVVPFAPESARDRMLHWRGMSIHYVDGDNNESNAYLSYGAFESLLLPLKIPENVTAYSGNTEAMSANTPNERMYQFDVQQTDHRFFDVFNLHFINGAPYTEADFESGLPKAVITRSVARDLFGTTDAAGREFLLNTAPYTVAGVVDEVSTLADHAYGQIWIPFTSTGLQENTWNSELGMLNATILARSASDFDAIRDEISRVGEALNSQLRESKRMEIIWRNRPYTQEKDAVAHWVNMEPDLEKDRKDRMIVFLILLIVPAINLSAMTQSRMRRRMEEIAVRRAYGASAWRIISSLLGENLVTTLIAGAVGLALCIVFALLCGPMLFSTMMTTSTIAPKVGMDVLLHWSTFAWAIGFCFVINLLCSGLPAWRASRQSIVNSLFGSTH